ncbi:MAG: addiction module protein [Gemmataceae bacterium]
MKPDIDISKLTPAECILLAEELWERARACPEAVPVPAEHLEEINRRIAAIDAGEMPPGDDWEIVRARLWGR